MYLIIMEEKHDAFDTDDYSCYGCYILKFSSSTYTLQLYLSIDGQVIFSGEILYEGTYFFGININSHYYIL